MHVAATVSWDQLRDLAGFRARKGCAISIFLNLDPSLAATAPEVATKINSLLDEAEKREAARRDRGGGRPRAAHRRRRGRGLLGGDARRVRPAPVEGGRERDRRLDAGRGACRAAGAARRGEAPARGSPDAA